MSAMGDRIKERRLAFGWSQSELGRRMVDEGFKSHCQMTITRSERGVRPIPIEEALALAGVLNVSIQWLATGSDQYKATDRYTLGYNDGLAAARAALNQLQNLPEAK